MGEFPYHFVGKPGSPERACLLPQGVAVMQGSQHPEEPVGIIKG